MEGQLTRAAWEAIAPYGGALVALSGGMDSVALLHALKGLSSSRFRLCAAHFEHGIRGEDSLGDLAFAQKLCEDWEIPFFFERAEVPKIAKESGENVEACARRLRYAFFEKIRLREGLPVTVTAHHLRDQAETLLLNLVRGSALRGMRGLGGQPGVLRPFLGVTKAEIGRYVRENGLSWREDLSNADERYARNFIRREVLPLLRRLNPEMERALGRAAREAAEDETFLSTLALEYLRGNEGAEGLRFDFGAPLPVLKRAARFFLQRDGEVTNSTQIYSILELAKKQSGARLRLGGRVYEARAGRVFLVPEGAFLPIALPGEGDFALPFGGSLSLRLCKRPKSLNQGRNLQFFAKESLSAGLCLRPALPGERFAPYGMAGTKLLSDLFIDEKLPRGLRPFVPLLASKSEILWVTGLRRGAAFPVQEGQNEVLCAEYRPKKHQEGE